MLHRIIVPKIRVSYKLNKYTRRIPRQSLKEDVSSALNILIRFKIPKKRREWENPWYLSFTIKEINVINAHF